MTSRFAKSLFSTVAVVAAIAVFALFFPRGASGSDPLNEASQEGVSAFRRNVEVSSPVAGDVQVFGGDVTIRSAVAGNVVVLGGNVILAAGGRIGGDLVCLGGEVRGIAPANVNVRGRVYAPRNGYSSVEAGRLVVASMRQPFSLLTFALELSLLVLWLLASVVLTLTNSRAIRSSSLELRASPFHSFILGLVAFTSFVLTAIVFSYLIQYFVGLLLLAALLVVAVAAKVYGMVAVFHAVGSLLAAPRRTDQLARPRWFRGDLALVVLGFAILGALRLIPYFGPIVWMSASALAVGVALSTRFGRREPWFLAWRPAEA